MAKQIEYLLNSLTSNMKKNHHFQLILNETNDKSFLIGHYKII